MAREPHDGASGQGQIVLAISLAVAAVMVMFLVPSWLSSRGRASVEREAVDLVTVAATVVAPAVHLGNVDGIQRAVDGLAVIPEVQYAAVWQRGEVLAGHRADLALAPGTVGARYTENTLHVSSAVPGVSPLATVHIGYGLDRVRSHQRVNLAISTLLSVMLLLAAVVAGMRGRTPQGLTLAEEAPEETTTQIFSGDEFVAYISHELRTPLNAIIGYAEMLEEDAAYLEQPDFIPDLKKIHRASVHMLALVDDVVSLQRVFSGTLELEVEEFMVDDLLEDVQKETSSLINRTLTTLSVQRAPDVRRMVADRGKLLRAITNVVREAAGVTGQGELELTVTRNSDSAGRLWVHYRITHPDLEITDAAITQMIKGFQGQQERHLPNYHKAGLGMVISREFCRCQGGELHVESDAETGTVFELRLPQTVA